MLALIKNYLERDWAQITPSIPKTNNLKFLLMNGGLARNLKATLLVFTEQLTPHIIIRISNDSCGKDYIKKEYNNLKTLSNKYQTNNIIPKALHLAELENHLLLFQLCVDGTLLLKHKKLDLFAQTCDWLINFHLKTKQEGISRGSYVHNIKGHIDIITKSIKISPGLKEFFAEIIQKCDQLGKDIFVFSHNDFSPRNIMLAPNGSVSGIIDWEYAEEHGFPLRDLYHLMAYYQPFINDTGLLPTLLKTFYRKNQLSLLARQKIISYCNALSIDTSMAELFFCMHLICWLKESIELSMPHYPLWEQKLFALESLVKQKATIKFIV